MLGIHWEDPPPCNSRNIVGPSYSPYYPSYPLLQGGGPPKVFIVAVRAGAGGIVRVRGLDQSWQRLEKRASCVHLKTTAQFVGILVKKLETMQ